MQGAGLAPADDRAVGICARRRRPRQGRGARPLARMVRPSRTAPIRPPVGGPANGFGVRDMVGLVWEWTLDFDAYATTAESRDPNGKDSAQFLRRRRGRRRRPDRLSGLHALFDAREPEGRLHRRQPRLSLRRRRAMRLRLLFAAAAAALRPRRRAGGRARHAAHDDGRAGAADERLALQSRVEMDDPGRDERRASARSAASRSWRRWAIRPARTSARRSSPT